MKPIENITEEWKRIPIGTKVLQVGCGMEEYLVVGYTTCGACYKSDCPSNGIAIVTLRIGEFTPDYRERGHPTCPVWRTRKGKIKHYFKEV